MSRRGLSGGGLREAPNYTNAFLVMAWVNLVWILMVLWVLWGFVVALLVCGGLHHLLRRWHILRFGRDFYSRSDRP